MKTGEEMKIFFPQCKSKLDDKRLHSGNGCFKRIKCPEEPAFNDVIINE